MKSRLSCGRIMLELWSIPAKELVAKRTEAHHSTVLYIFIHIFF